MTTKREAAPGRSGGYSLVELLTAVSIAGILLTTAMPALGTLAANERRTDAVNDLLLTLLLAHSEGAKRGGRIMVVCGLARNSPGPGLGAQPCSGHDWSAGWMLGAWSDANADGTVGAGEFTPIRVFQPPAGGQLSIRAGNFTATPPVQPGGTVMIKGLGWHSSNGTITVCDRRGSREARAVIVSSVGRARVSSRSASGGALTCP